MKEKREIISALRDKTDVVNMRTMRTGWSKLLNQQEKILVLTSRGRVTGFYIPYEVARGLPNQLKVIFLYLLDIYARKVVPELEEIAKEEESSTSVKSKGNNTYENEKFPVAKIRF